MLVCAEYKYNVSTHSHYYVLKGQSDRQAILASQPLWLLFAAMSAVIVFNMLHLWKTLKTQCLSSNTSIEPFLLF